MAKIPTQYDKFTGRLRAYLMKRQGELQSNMAGGLSSRQYQRAIGEHKACVDVLAEMNGIEKDLEQEKR